jgi:hypothetical protein
METEKKRKRIKRAYEKVIIKARPENSEQKLNTN